MPCCWLRYAVGLTQALGRMRNNVAATVALVLAMIAWPAMAWGALSLLGDYARDTPQEIIRANTLRSHVAVAIGSLASFAAIWLSGYTWSTAKKRATVSLALVGLPLLVALASLFR